MIDFIHDFLLSFGVLGALAWIVLKILAIAMPVIITVAFYVVWERKLIGWMHVRHGPMYIGPWRTCIQPMSLRSQTT